MKNSLRIRVAALSAAILLLAGCGSVKIARVLNEPQRYANRSVRVQGTVTNSFGAVVAGAYQVEDDTGKIYVISNGSVPRKGARVSVQGKVMNGITLGTRSFGTAIREERHSFKY